MKPWMYTLIFAAAVGLPAHAQFREDGEAQTQVKLPQSQSPVWPVLRQTKVRIDEAKGMFTASFPAPVKALAGKPMTVSGFMMPLEPAARVRHFLLSKYTPVCSFCPPGDPNEVIEVRTTAPVAVGTKMITVSGRFALENNGEKGLFFQLDGAKVG